MDVVLYEIKCYDIIYYNKTYNFLWIIVIIMIIIILFISN